MYELGLLKIPVSNIAASAAFYRDTLGLELQFAADEYGWAQLQAGMLPVALYKPGMGGGAGTIGSSTGFHLTLPPDRFDGLSDVADLDAVFDRCRGLGCQRVDSAIKTQPWGERSFYAQDPFGNPICFVAETTVFTGEPHDAARTTVQ